MLRTASAIKTKVAGVVRPAVSGRIMVDGDLETFFTSSGGFTASAHPASQGAQTTSTTATGGVTITPSGGVGPYTYSHTVTLYTGALPVVLSPSSASSSVRQSPIFPGETNVCQFNCLVTDSLGQTANAPYTITFSREDV